MKYELINGNSLEVLKTLEENSIDSIVTDPPYELGFMGKSWDKSGIAFNIEIWKEALRVLKPGGHLIAFSGSRTYHRMAVAIEDSGFEIRDQLLWLYGSGFPKSLDIGKAIDKKLGAEREIIGNGKSGSSSRAYQSEKETTSGEYNITSPATEQAKQWNGWGTSLKPSHEPMVLARKPLSEKTVAENVLKWGTGAININDCRVENINNEELGRNNKNIKNSIFNPNNGWNSNSLVGLDTTGNTEGRWPSNLIHDGSKEVLEIFPFTKSGGGNKATKNKDNTFLGTGFGGSDNTIWKSDEGSASRYFYCAKANKKDRNEGLDDNFEEKRPDTRTDIGMGTFEEKGVAIQKNHHPTVKPSDLMQYLVKLITPENGIILDPFNGSGSTGKACAILNKGYQYIGIDLSQEYLDISKARIDNQLNKGK